MTLTELKDLLDSGKFHHATYRTDYARGLHIYSSDAKGHRGFVYVGCFSESLTDKATIDAAYNMVRGTGVSLGAFGNG